MNKARITSIDTYLVDVPVKTKKEFGDEGVFPFTVSYGSLEGLKRVFLKLEATTDEGNRYVGWGESSPLYPYSNESALSVFEMLKSYYSPALQGVIIDGSTPQKAKERVDEVLTAIEPFCAGERLNFLQTAIDYALHDLAGRITNTPVFKLLNPDANSEQVQGTPCWSISCRDKDFDAEIEASKKFAKKGYALKLKLGSDLDSNILATVALLNLYGNGDYFNIRIRADANAAMSPAEYREYEEKVSQAVKPDVLNRVQFYVEEPIDTKRYGYQALGDLIRSSRWEIMADESLYTLEDAHRLIDLAGDSDKLLFNVKVQKVGGLRNAMKVAALAKEKGIEIMIGGMFPSSLGKLANCHYALAIEGFLESDGIHPSLDYIPESHSVVSNISELEVVADERRDLSVFGDKPGFGAIVSEQMIKDHLINIDLSQYYPDFSGFRIRELEGYKNE